MAKLQFGFLGAGFWAGYQLAAWHEISDARCMAVCDTDREKAQALAARFQIRDIYTDPEELLQRTDLDFVDIVTPPATHVPLIRRAVARQLPVISQKPLAESLPEAEAIVRESAEAGVPLLVHENWRWQTPFRAVKSLLDEGRIGTPFRARMEMISGFPLFENQPFLKTLERFILADLGVHLLDTARFLFGEADSVYCTTRRIHPDIQGEDVATVTLTQSGLTFLCQMAYAGNPLERERFPETFLFIEGDRGSLELGPDYLVRLTTNEGTLLRRYPPSVYSWVNPAYAIVQTSMVPCLTNLLAHLRGEAIAETTGADNLNTLRLIEAAYQSAATGEVRGPSGAVRG